MLPSEEAAPQLSGEVTSTVWRLPLLLLPAGFAAAGAGVSASASRLVDAAAVAEALLVPPCASPCVLNTKVYSLL